MATDDTLKITHTSTTHPGAWIAFTWSWEDGACTGARWCAAGFPDSVDTDALAQAMLDTGAAEGRDHPGFTWDVQ